MTLSEHQLADIFTKPLARDRFFFIWSEWGILDGSSIEWLFCLMYITCCILLSILLDYSWCVLVCWFVCLFIFFFRKSHAFLGYFVISLCFNWLLFVLINYYELPCDQFFKTFCFNQLRHYLIDYHWLVCVISFENLLS